MKRPTGFDSGFAAPTSDAPAASTRRSTRRSITASATAIPTATPTTTPPAKENHAIRAPRVDASPTSATRDEIRSRAAATGADAATQAAVAERRARAELRRAARIRRRYERAEMRRFTRRSRRRRITWLVSGALVLTMVGLVAVAVFSPLLALREIRVDGTSRLSSLDIVEAVDGQLDTPLALLDMGKMTRQLGEFPLIRSFVTETVPPGTLVIHIVERQAIGSLQAPGGFSLVDPAGVEIEKSVERIAGVPLIDTGGADASSEAFTAAIEVLVAMPDSVVSQLDTISARTRDDVVITLVSGGARIVWGSADDSAYKARVLQAALSKNFPGVTEYNVSAPGQLTYR